MTLHLSLDDEARERASLYALDALPPAEGAEFAAHLEACTACRDEVGSLRRSAAELQHLAPPATPSPDLKRRLMERIAAADRPATTQVWKRWTQQEVPTGVVIRADEGGFEPTAIAGIRVRRLFADPSRDRVTMLVRMEPGTAYPRHRHGGSEECYVLSGDLRVGEDLEMRAGDFQRVELGSEHAVQSTRGGCLLLISSSLSDEIVEGAAG